MHWSQSPSSSQLVHAEGRHFDPAHRPSLQTPEEQEEEEEQYPPSEVFEDTHWYELRE